MKLFLAALNMEPEENLPLTLFRPTPTHSRPTTPVPHPLSNATPFVLPPPPEYVLQEYRVPLRPSAPSPDFTPLDAQQELSITELSQQIKDISGQIQNLQRDLNRLRNRHESTLDKVYLAINGINFNYRNSVCQFSVLLAALVFIGTLLVYYGVKEDWFEKTYYRG